MRFGSCECLMQMQNQVTASPNTAANLPLVETLPAKITSYRICEQENTGVKPSIETGGIFTRL